MLKLVLEKEPEIKLPTYVAISKKQENSIKTSASLTLPNSVWVTMNWKILKELGIPEQLTCLLRYLYAGQEEIELDMEQQTGSK